MTLLNRVNHLYIKQDKAESLNNLNLPIKFTITVILLKLVFYAIVTFSLIHIFSCDTCIRVFFTINL